MNKIVSVVKESFNNLTLLSKYSLAVILVANLPLIRDFLVLQGVGAIGWSPWTMFTNTFVSEYYNLPLGIMFLMFSLKYFENVWGMAELFRYLWISTAVSQIFLIFLVLLSSLFMGSQILFTPIYGFNCVIFGFLVAYKQLVPEHRLLIGGYISFRTKVLPILAISGIGFMTSFFAVLDSPPFSTFYYYLVNYYQGWCGILGSWGYLRFYQRRDGILGDRSETFSILSFFPESTHTYLAPVSNFLFEIGLKMKIIPGASRYAPLDNQSDNQTDNDENLQGINLKTPELFSEEVDAERRRNLGLKALESKLQQK